jgi:hypothetical protein
MGRPYHKADGTSGVATALQRHDGPRESWHQRGYKALTASSGESVYVIGIKTSVRPKSVWSQPNSASDLDQVVQYMLGTSFSVNGTLVGSFYGIKYRAYFPACYSTAVGHVLLRN